MHALVWAVDHGHELLDLVSAAETTEDAVAEVMRLAGVTEVCAVAVMDAQIRRWTGEYVRKIKDEQADLQQRLHECGGRSDRSGPVR